MKNSSMLLTREALLQRNSLIIEKVELFKGHVFVREMTGHEKDVWEQSLLKQKPNDDKTKQIEYETSLEDFRAKLAVVTVCDAEGNLLFQPEDAKTLNSVIKAKDIEKIVEVAQKLNAVTEKDKDNILKNSEADKENSSSSDSAVI
jgi:hypothetical protein